MEPGRNGSREDEAIQALGREVGRRSVERLGTGLTRIIEETSALYRWTLTMLVLLNGAALYLCVSARESMGAELFQLLVLIFFAGMMAALFAALLGMALTLPVAGAMRKALAHWTDVSVSGALSDGAMASARQVKRSSAVWLTVMSLIVLVSLGLFSTGALLLGERFGMVGPNQPDSTALEVVIPPASELDAEAGAQSVPAEIAPAGNQVSVAPPEVPVRVVAPVAAAVVAQATRPAQIAPPRTTTPPRQAAQKAPTPKVATSTAARATPVTPARAAPAPARQASAQTPAARPTQATPARATPAPQTAPPPEFVPLPVLRPSIAE